MPGETGYQPVEPPMLHWAMPTQPGRRTSHGRPAPTTFMLHRLLLSCLVSLACLLPGAAALAEQLDIMVEDAAAPWSRSDGTGYANEIVAAAFAAVGVDVKFTVLPYSRCKARVVAGLAPACFSISPEADLPDTIVLADKPIFTMHSKFFHNTAAPKTAAGIDALQPGTVVALVNGYEYPDAIRGLKARGIVLDQSNSELISLKKLAVGRVDYAVVNVDRIKTEAELLQQAGIGNVAFAFDGGSLGSYIGFSKTHPQGDYARRQFNAGYALVARNGTLDKIRRRWEPQKVPKKN
ncbi:transporter substrate-binding domain-containing protein [Oxalobacteraceae bacterium OM1]|nr:transporter substrate-binding domain-containing protein [Oxalobacteraceae bacterium OM1]